MYRHRCSDLVAGGLATWIGWRHCLLICIWENWQKLLITSRLLYVSRRFRLCGFLCRSAFQWTNCCPSVLDTVGWVVWPVKIVPDMTYNVFGGTLNPTLLLLLSNKVTSPIFFVTLSQRDSTAWLHISDQLIAAITSSCKDTCQKQSEQIPVYSFQDPFQHIAKYICLHYC